MPNAAVASMAHLMRRAGMGATRPEHDDLTSRGYDQVVDDLVAIERDENGNY